MEKKNEDIKTIVSEVKQKSISAAAADPDSTKRRLVVQQTKEFEISDEKQKSSSICDSTEAPAAKLIPALNLLEKSPQSHYESKRTSEFEDRKKILSD